MSAQSRPLSGTSIANQSTTAAPPEPAALPEAQLAQIPTLPLEVSRGRDFALQLPPPPDLLDVDSEPDSEPVFTPREPLGMPLSGDEPAFDDVGHDEEGPLFTARTVERQQVRGMSRVGGIAHSTRPHQSPTPIAHTNHPHQSPTDARRRLSVYWVGAFYPSFR